MEDRCVCCGALIPEGKMVCPNCCKKGGVAYDAQNEKKADDVSDSEVGNSVKPKTLD